MQYKTLADLNLYSSTALDSLVTQGAIGRWVEVDVEIDVEIEGIVPSHGAPQSPIQVTLVEDAYSGWLDPQDWQKLGPTTVPYVPQQVTRSEIQSRLPAVIAFTQAAMAVPNSYLWGGTVAPNYDCSGLMQAAFRSVGIQLPRDAYQQEAFLEPIEAQMTIWQPGDLIFFGPAHKATHVGLYLGNGQYIHSSGQDHGRNGIGIDRLLSDDLNGETASDADPVSRHYFASLRGAGRVVQSYVP